MNAGRARFALLATTIGCLALAGGVVAVQVVSPVPPISASKNHPEAASDNAAAPTTMPDFSEVKSKPLRRPLTEPEALSVKAPEPTIGMDFHLLGTVIEPGNTYAIFQVSKGQIEVCREGESAGVAEVIRIEPGHVTIRYNGKTRQLSLPKPGDSFGS